MSVRTARGLTLVELLVALFLLELIGIAALSAILTSERVGRRVTMATQIDADRWRRYREAEVSPTCADTTAYHAIPITLDDTEVRPSLALTLGCGK